MWLRSEHVSRRLRGRLNNSCTSETKIYNYRVQVRNIRKLPSVNNNNHRINVPNKYGRLTRWRRRCTHFLKEVCIIFYFFFFLILNLNSYICCIFLCFYSRYGFNYISNYIIIISLL